MPARRSVRLAGAVTCAAALAAAAVALLLAPAAGAPVDAPVTATVAALPTVADDLAAERSTPSGPSVVVATPDGVLVLRDPDGPDEPVGGTALAAGPGSVATVRDLVSPAGAEHTSVVVQDAVTGADELRLEVPGAWTTPRPVASAPAQGFSWDGSTLVLQHVEDPARFLVLSPRRPDAAPHEIALEGAVNFDAVSADGSLLFVVERVGELAAPVARVRAVDVATGRVLPRRVAHPQDREDVLSGSSAARVTTRAVEHTIDVGGLAPCVRSLTLTRRPVSRCAVLPLAGDDPVARATWSIAASTDGSVAVAANGRLGVAYVVRALGAPVAVELAGRSDEAPALAVASRREAYVQTDAGLERLDLAAGTTVLAGAAPPGLALLVAAPDAVLAVGADGGLLGAVP